MAVAQSVITVDPGGRVLLVDIQNMAGTSVTVYDAADSGNTRTLPMSISTVTSFYLPTPGDYQVSAKVNGREIAGTNATKQAVTVPRVGEIRVVPVVDAGEALDAGEITGTTQLGYAERASNDTTTNTAYASAPSNKISGLSVTVVGQGLPVTVEFYCPQVYHSVANTLVSAELLINGALATGQFASAFSPSTAAGPFLLMRRKPLLVAGTSYTFEVGKSVSGAGTGTYTGAADSLMHLDVSR